MEVSVTTRSGVAYVAYKPGALLHDSKEKEAVDILIAASECHEVGLGSSATRRGKRIGKEKAEQIVSLFRSVPKYETHGFRHFEEIQFFVDGISKDRISDITCSFIKSFLIDFTIDQCEQLGIPLSNVKLKHVYDYRRNTFSPEPCRLPINPESGDPIILVPKRWLTVHLIDQYAAYRLSELSSA